MKAKKKKIETLEPAAADDRIEVISMEMPPERAGGKVVGEGPEAAPELAKLLKEEAKVI
jgi:electron transfer flavoprotein beta subunit